ncbi:MAG: 50S ribosomal protein L19 [Candidatus Doudnabacteria bacterium RIFCSPHIGHO2_02_FULL_42_25]|uniref:50S ribosomal protein L19 n=1 Tax=Candidatus Doudnabacteria bacterium RIFCSPHIGHO2_01_FULL_41_86 TaxID=1817821 RepID=A0A1F5N8K3_9BACT|nr:MAG: 50S ribosomal protein L19 [Candidatus Doudnabacteria bacterium RIFCSPHIGHO2_01_FULL_41_86]OGE75785.1 MAG: 50S ribosomal protein L19 [Candidatus Doudnabacteria bacterium RIFCSPHIGHO2_01_43_10]OGE86447.1 MAG: 50S ribosomal protein L19 [Candidatus Doudnabacteria bacterium RIFCSPHIGHO2_12_FULL_42_22]OGE87446.1 MAG: 50S ribosomal protein L19 [Candidatus Doudnabacteria bacterium RIFCSPHIGHO2_02_FULL_42_25]OGE92744.1 MAG: 50S ribosomal protein L19 [Candidatus Doudnabacteria bacterium RIFCSPLOW
MQITSFRTEQLKQVPVLKSGYVVRVHQKIKDVSSEGKEKERIQIFEGQVIGTKGGKGINGTVTVRKISSGVGVERIFPIHSPSIDKIEVVKATPARKAKVYYSRTGQEVRVQE